MSREVGRVACAAALLLVTTVPAWAQQTTTTTQTKKFEVIAVEGNDLVVRLPEGTRDLNVPDDFRFTVEGQQLSVHDLKPGMKGTATITTKTTVTPVTVTEVKNGTVMNVTGSSMIVRTEQGIKSFTQGDVDKRGVKIVRNGQPAQLSDFRSGDQLTATIITTKPPRVVTERQVQATLARSAPANAPAGAAGAPAAAPGAAAPTTGTSAPAPKAGRKLPKTGSALPLLGLVGVASLLAGLALGVRRRLLIG